MREWVGGVIKKVTLEAIYKVVEERTQLIVEKQEKDKQELLANIQRLEEKQERDKQELQKTIQETRQELLGRIQRLEERQEKFQDEMRAEFRHINQRIDKVMEMLLTIGSNLRKEE